MLKYNYEVKGAHGVAFVCRKILLGLVQKYFSKRKDRRRRNIHGLLRGLAFKTSSTYQDKSVFKIDLSERVWIKHLFTILL